MDWLVQEQTALGKDKSKLLKAGGLLKITWLSSGPQFLLEPKHWATPEVMDFGKETSNPLSFSQKIARDQQCFSVGD